MRRLAQICSGVLLVAYPLFVWLLLERATVAQASFGIAAAAAVILAVQVLRHEGRLREIVTRFWTLALPIVFAVATGLTGEHRLLLMTPVVINLGLLLVFVTSLFSGQGPMVERFARMMEPTLDERQVAYCRTVTVVWSCFFAANALVALALAVAAPLTWWAAYTGGIAYGLMGLLFAVEITIRKIRFRRYGGGLVDRVFARLFPPYAP